MARVLITGVSGQLGSYAAEQLVAAGHEALGVTWPADSPLPQGVRRCPTALAPETAAQVLDDCGDLDAVIHLAGISSVAQSWSDPLAAFDMNARLTVALVHALARRSGTRLVHASSAEIFGKAAAPAQNEDTPIAPVSPYGVSKAAAHIAVRFGREALGAPMSNLIMYLAESERRPPHFVFRKITRGLAAVHLGLSPHLALGDTSVVRDFSHASDVATALVLVALGSTNGDFVCASGHGHSILEIATTACEFLSLDPARVLRTDPGLVRPADIPSLVGDSTRLRALGWHARTDFRQLVRTILDHDLAELRAGTTQAP